MSKEIVILGGGYGGLLAALSVRQYMDASEANVTIINKTPTHQIITELHRLAAGNISEQAAALPLEKLLKGKDINLKVATIESFSVNDKKISLEDGSELFYDALVVALGSVTNYFGIPGLQEHSMVLKSAEDANKIREHVEARIRDYAATNNEADAHIVIGGGGLTGVELVGESGIEVNRGRASVNNYLQSVSHKDVFVVGDSAVYFKPGDERPQPPTAQIAWQMGETVGYNLYAYLEDKSFEEFEPVNSGTLASLGRKDAVAFIGANQTPLKGLPASVMKEASNVRYLSHIKGLFALAY
ncbi:NAD(P)/FAD-dependent oxidoreductase [Halobacillus aidingensis]|uniref:Pyridine nucleotide-disulphide oxidoreductase n=1 Tax=Halobacillus aidingensis TaxID=240303 RepID=A0A1H0IQS4_HALAD|nr:FAD-dependent oxidoreductase [Halobacillus aidingensis]SDO33844.1 Pyridine nucleotide-disulphide oxidoreductase [Halobacillus aidingensis]